MKEIDRHSLLLINREWQRLQGVIDTRAAEARAYQEKHGKEEGPGMSTGLLVKRVRITGKRQPVKTTTYTLDCKTLRELRALEWCAMRELLSGQERAETAVCTPMVAEPATARPVSLTVRRSPGAPVCRPERIEKAA